MSKAGARIQDIYPLSPMQEGMLFHALYDSQADAYFGQVSYRIRGRIRPELVEAGLNLLLDRHDILRTAFIHEGQEKPLQVVLRKRTVSFTVIDISTSASPGLFISEYREKDRKRVFDLSKDVLMRGALLRLSDEEWEFVWSYHHILMDGWCIGLLTNEFRKIYAGLLSGHKYHLNEVQQYKQYIQWLGKRNLSEDLVYWKSYLKGYVGVASLGRPARASVYVQENFIHSYNNRLCEELHRFSAQQQATISTLLSTAWGVLLCRYSNRNDVVFGTVVSGRPAELPGVEQMIGLFINTVPVRVNYQAGQTFQDLLGEANARSGEGLAYHYCPLAEIQAIVGNGQQLMDHIVVFENYPLDALTGNSNTPGDDFDVTAVDVFEETGYDLNVIVCADEALSIKFKYNAAVYSQEFIKSVACHLEHLLTEVMRCLDRPVDVLSLITPEERVLLDEWNNTFLAAEPQLLLHASFQGQACATPENIAVYPSLTYEKLDKLSNQLAHYLRITYDIRPDDLIGLVAARTEWLPIGIMAILKSGAGYVPIDAALPDARKRHILGDARVKAVLNVTDALLEFLQPTVNVSAGTGMFDAYPATAPALINSPDDIAYVIYTSGSTGMPKGCMISHRSVSNLVAWHRAAYAVSSGSRATLYADIGFDASVWEMFPYLLSGAGLYPVSADIKMNIPALCDFMNVHQVTHCFLPTPVCEEIMWMPGIDPERWILTGGEQLKKINPGLRIVNNYGPTENTVVSSCIHLKGYAGDGPVPIGRAIANTKLFILDSNLQPVPIGVPGEICISGAGLARGYLHLPELTEEKFVPHPFEAGSRLYRSGDIGYMQADGNIVFTGRRDDQVKIRGYRVEPGEIAHVLGQFAGISSAVVMAWGSGEDRYLAAYYLSGDKIEESLLRSYLRDLLPGYMMPSCFVWMSSFPLTVSGKIDRSALPEPVGAGRGSFYESARNKREALLTGIWEGILGAKRIGIHDNFFELGGHSLKAMRLVSQVSKVLEQSLSLREVFEHPTIAAQSTLLRQREESHHEPIPLAAVSARYALSPAQKRLWILSELDPDSTAYHIPGAYYFEGAVDLDALDQAFSEVMGRHEILRTVFGQEGGIPYQQVLPVETLGGVLMYDDLRGREAAESSLVSSCMFSRFDLCRGPLWRSALLQLSERRYVFVLSLHHIISDGWSMDILLRELIHSYNCYSAGVAPVFPSLRIQYKDYSSWQNSLDHEQGRAYWHARFSGDVPRLELPGDHRRPEAMDYHGASVELQTGRDLYRRLQAACRRHNVSPFMYLLSVVNALFYRYTGQRDITTGTAVAGRDHTDLDDQVGFYINTLGLRVYIDEDSSFSSLLAHVRDVTLEGYAHQSYPFEELVSHLGIMRDNSRMPLFDVLVVMQNQGTAASELRADGIEVSGYGSSIVTSKYDLSIIFSEQGDDLEVRLEYRTALYAPARMDRMLVHMLQLLEASLQDAGVPVKDLDYLGASEKDYLLNELNSTACTYPSEATLVSLFSSQVLISGDAVAVCDERVTLSYRELDRITSQLGHYLHCHYGVGGGDLLGVMTTRSVWQIVSILGILKSGGGYVPVDPLYPEERKRYMLSDAGVKALLVHGTAGLSGIPTVDLEALSLPDEPAMAPPVINSPSDIAYVIYTSGSTGEPKGCVLEHRAIVNRIHWMQQQYQFSNTDVVLQKTPLIFDVSVWEIFMTLCYGGKLVVCNKEVAADPAALTRCIIHNNITIIHFVPSMLSVWLDYLSTPPVSLRYVVASGEALLPAVTNKYYEILEASLHNLYGPTEAAVDVSYYEVKKGDTEIPIGIPIHNIQLYILDSHLKLRPAGVDGQICISGTGLAREYLNKAALTSERFVPHPYKKGERLYLTGDTGRRLMDGNILYTGRLDEQVKIRGYRIEPGDIVSAILSLPGITMAAVVVKEAAGNKYLAAYYSSPERMPVSKVRSHLMEKLPAYMIPAYFMQVEEFPVTASGKIDKNKLPDPAEQAPGYQEEDEGAVTDVMLLMMDVWKSVLGRKSVGKYDDFFEIGGDSIKAIQVSARLLEAGYQLTIKELLSQPRISLLADVVRKIERHTIAPQGAVSGQVPLTPIQKAFFKTVPFHLAHHYGQSAMFHSPDGFSEEAVRAVIDKLQEHHDALRMRYNNLVQENMPPSRYSNLLVYDLRNTTDPVSQISRLGEEVKAGLHLEDGPLFRVALFQHNDGSHLLIFIHHLVIDAVSWRILLEDLDTLYQQYLRNVPMELPAKTTAFKDYALQLEHYANNGIRQEEMDYWTMMERRRVPSLPGSGKAIRNLRKDTATVSFSLDRKQTTLLLTDIHKAYGTAINDVLLAALGMAVREVFGLSQLLVDLEGHGRDINAANVNAGRTIGWFTTIYPVVLEFNKNSTLREQIIGVKEILHRVPSNGIGYGIIKHMSSENIDWQLKPDICFNYLGQVDTDLDKASFAFSDVYSGEDQHPLIERNYLLEINGIVSGNSLTITIIYNPGVHSETVITALSDHFCNFLSEIILHCSAAPDKMITPVDLTYKQLSVEDLDDLFN